MTLNKAIAKKMHKVVGIECSYQEVLVALQELGIFEGTSICKICENRNKCGIYQLYGSQRVMLHSEISKYIKIDELSNTKKLDI